MRGVGALLATRLDQPPFDQAVQQHVEDQPGQVVLDEPGPELRQHAEVEPRIIQLQPAAVLPVDPGPYRLAGLPIGQITGELQRCHQRQLSRRQPRSTPSRERRQNRSSLNSSPNSSRTRIARSAGERCLATLAVNAGTSGNLRGLIDTMDSISPD